MEIFDVDAYFGALADIMKVHHQQPDSRESVFLRQLAESMDYNLEGLVEFPPEFAAHALKESSMITRRIVLRDCIRMARADFIYDDAEHARILDLAEKLGISQQDIQDMIAWLDAYDALKEQEDKLFLTS
jgi:uncharacterized membrane protein YebE (DUF533 family)